MTDPGRIALASGDLHASALRDVEVWLLEGRPALFVQIACAVGFDGERTLGGWREAGRQAADRHGAQLVTVDIRSRAEAESVDLAAALSTAGLVTITAASSENLVRTLAGTRAWTATLDAWRSGASLAAGGVAAMALGGYVPDVRHPRRGGTRGLGLVPDLRLVPDVDSLGPAVPHAVFAPLADPRAAVVGLDAATALTGEPADDSDDGRWEFRARGRGSAWMIEAERLRRVLAPLRLAVGTRDGAGS